VFHWSEIETFLSSGTKMLFEESDLDIEALCIQLIESDTARESGTTTQFQRSYDVPSIHELLIAHVNQPSSRNSHFKENLVAAVTYRVQLYTPEAWDGIE
jgi:hypothetical protein